MIPLQALRTPPAVSCRLALILATCAPFRAGQAQSHQPQAILFDSTRLTAYSTQELLDLLSEPSFKQNVHSQGIYNTLPPDPRRQEAPVGPDPRFFVRLPLDAHALDFTRAIEKELINRRPLAELLNIFATTTDQAQQAWMIDVLGQMRSPATDSALHRFPVTGSDRGSYLELKYFALGCDTVALGILNSNYGHYDVPSIEWASIVRSFGECKYYRAAPNLVASITALMLDLGYAAHTSLRALYPDARIDFRDPNKARQEWNHYVASHR